MDIKILSRKFVLSAVLAVLATLFMWWKIVDPAQWQWVIMATVVSYVASKAMEKATGSETDTRETKISIGIRIKSLFSREFILAFGTVLVTSVFLYLQIIPSSVWFTICSALAAAYNIGVAVAKL